MAIERKQQVSVFIISFLMMLSVVGGTLLFVLQSNQAERESDERQEIAAQQERATACRSAGADFTNEDLEIPDVYTVDENTSELVTEDLKEGDGAEVVSGDCVVINYHGNLAVDGGVFDSSFERDNPFSTFIGESQVIEGWDQGVVGMKVGGVRRLVIPYELAYGEEGRTIDPFTGELVKDKVDVEEDVDPNIAVDSDEDGKVDYIPRESDLVFEVELLDIVDLDEE